MSTSKLFGKDILITSTTEATSNTVGAFSTLGGISATKTILTAGGITSLSNTNTLGNLFTTGGNVGIGTTAPVQSLQINGNLNFTGNLYQNATVFSGSTQWGSSGANIYFNTGNVGIGTTAPLFTLDVRTTASSSYVVTGNFISSGLTAGQQNGIVIGKANSANNAVELRHFHAADGSNQNMLRIGAVGRDNMMVVRYDGNVGIGTTAPNSALEVNGTITLSNPLAQLSQSRLTFINHTDNFIYAGGTVGNYSITYNSEAAVPQGPVGYMAGWGSLRFFTQGAPRLNIDHSGNIGIGTTAPSARLDVNGNFEATGAIHTIGSLFISGGNVGIGTTSPKQALQVGGGLMVAASNPIVDQGAYIQWNRTGGQGETWLINQRGGGTNDSIRLASAATNGSTVTEWWRFQSNNLYNMVGGNIFIDSAVAGSQFIFGYNTPKQSAQEDRLAVYNNLTDRNLAFRVTSRGTVSGSDFVESTVPFRATFNSNTVGNIFTTGGNVGIGTATPVTRLQVNGSIKSVIPSWSIYYVGSGAFNATSIITYNTSSVTAQNITVNAGTGRITCTVAGRYYVSFSAFAQNDSSTATQVYLLKNGANVARFYNSSKVANQYGPSMPISVLVDLAVNDYLEASLSIGSLHANDNVYFMGYMIG